MLWLILNIVRGVRFAWNGCIEIRRCALAVLCEMDNEVFLVIEQEEPLRLILLKKWVKLKIIEIRSPNLVVSNLLYRVGWFLQPTSYETTSYWPKFGKDPNYYHPIIEFLLCIYTNSSIPWKQNYFFHSIGNIMFTSLIQQFIREGELIHKLCSQND